MKLHTYQNILNKEKITATYIGEHVIDGSEFIVLEKNNRPLQILKSSWKLINESELVVNGKTNY